ncbi:hypothetical protein [Legionella fairfieldensis]|uniref:hypothetical protein n=1 Tax=Legionella fairfieldensis TaxID=45064 RepID=UPI0006847B42|nr:hypothetical protein [Legionella fairfieldensis]
MGQSKIQLRQLNEYSWSVILAFICATLAMQYHTASIHIKDFFQVLPLIIVFISWCEKSAYFIKQPESNLKKTEIFNRDTFILSFSFLLACLISLLFAYDNSDAKGWWVLIVYFITLYGLFFSLIFSLIALLIKNHKIYTMIFSSLIVALISLGNFFPHYISLPLIGNVDTFFVITGSLLIVHCLFAMGYKVVRLFFNTRRAAYKDKSIK